MASNTSVIGALNLTSVDHMKLNIGVAARDRMFSKSMRRVRPQLDELGAALEAVKMLDPLQTSTLILVTDENEPGSLKVVSSNDGTFQVIAGCSPGLAEGDLKKELAAIVRKTVDASSFSSPDRDAFDAVIKSWETAQS